MRFSVFASAVLAALAASGFAAANDSVAESAAGGLVLKQSDEIDMVEEDLYVSAEEIRVRYLFRNRSGRDVRTIVAFPMPDRDFAELRFSDSAFPADFGTLVDGRPVTMRVERKALLGETDHSALLAELGLPLDADNMLVAVAEGVDRLTPQQQRRLIELGLVEASEYDSGDGMRRRFEPVWTLRETWYWEQVFPAGRDLIVEHRYTPGAGGTVGTALVDPQYRRSDDARATIERYCVDDAFLAGLDRAVRRTGNANYAETWIGYVLRTGANWRSPIGRFRLVVDKGSPDNFVSFCGEGVRRISPTRFEMVRTNWRPDRDLDVLILAPVDYD